MLRIYIFDRIYLPRSLVVRAVEKYGEQDTIEYFIIKQFEEFRCSNCGFLPKRFDERVCGICPAYLGESQLYRRIKREGEAWYGFPTSQLQEIIKRFGLRRLLKDGKLEIIDKRPITPFRNKWKLIRPLYSGRDDQADQVAIVEEFLSSTEKSGCGILACAPRTGKNMLSIAVTFYRKARTLVTAAELSWLEQWLDDLLEFSNLSKLPHGCVCIVSTKPSTKKFKDTNILIVPSWEKVPKTADIVVSTYQSLIYNAERFDKVRRQFDHIIVDEAHLSPALAFSRILNNMAVRYRTALTGTPDRNDGMSPILFRIMGNVAAVSDKAINPPTLYFLQTKFQSNIDPSQDVKLVSAIIRNAPRLRLVLAQIFKDLEADENNCLLLPVNRVAYAQRLVKMINDQAAYYNAQHKKTIYPMPLAALYTGKTKDLAKVREMASRREIRVTVANIKMARHGLSIPAWNIVYTGLTPMTDSNNFYQLINRVCTPPKNGEKKLRPIVRHVLDASYWSKNKFLKMYKAKYKPIRQLIKEGKILLSEQGRDVLENNILNGASSTGESRSFSFRRGWH